MNSGEADRVELHFEVKRPPRNTSAGLSNAFDAFQTVTRLPGNISGRNTPLALADCGRHNGSALQVPMAPNTVSTRFAAIR